jgi:hypothetical protein
MGGSEWTNSIYAPFTGGTSLTSSVVLAVAAVVIGRPSPIINGCCPTAADGGDAVVIIIGIGVE